MFSRLWGAELAHIEARTPSSERKSDVRPEQEVRKILSGTFYLPDIQVTGITFKQAAAVGEPSKAHCELALSLPPGVNALRAREELEKAVRANIPLIADLSFSDAVTADGWESNKGDIVLPVIKDAVEAAFSPMYVCLCARPALPSCRKSFLMMLVSLLALQPDDCSPVPVVRSDLCWTSSELPRHRDLPGRRGSAAWWKHLCRGSRQSRRGRHRRDAVGAADGQRCHQVLTATDWAFRPDSGCPIEQ